MLCAWDYTDEDEKYAEWDFKPDVVLEHVERVAGIESIWLHRVYIEQSLFKFKDYNVYNVMGRHKLDREITDLNNKIIDDVERDFKRMEKRMEKNIGQIEYIRLPPMLIFTNKVNTNNALFTDRIELQNEKFISAHDEKSNEKYVYRLKGFLVRDEFKCVSYMRKKNVINCKTLLADSWYRSDVTGSIKMHEYIDEDEKVLVPELDVEMQNVSNDGEKEVICFYEAERRIDEEIKVIHPSGQIEQDLDGYRGNTVKGNSAENTISIST